MPGRSWAGDRGDDEPYGWRVRAFKCIGGSAASTYVDAPYLSPSRIYEWPTSTGRTFYGTGDSIRSSHGGATLIGVCPSCYGIDLAVNRGPHYGSFKVYVDGRYGTTIPTYAARSTPAGSCGT